MDENMLLVAAIWRRRERRQTSARPRRGHDRKHDDGAVRRLFIIDGAKALSKAIRRTFGRGGRRLRQPRSVRRRNVSLGQPDQTLLLPSSMMIREGNAASPLK